MTDPARTILEQLCSHAFKSQAPCWFATDRAGKIQQWGGSPKELGLADPAPQGDIADLLLFMEGILPLDNEAMEFSCIRMPNGICVDARVFLVGAGWGILVWDSSREEAFLTQTQQKCNELSLLIQRHKQQMERFADQKPFLEALFRALNMAVLEMNPQGGFTLLGTPPDWFRHITGAEDLLAGSAHEEDDFSFLGNFIQEAKTRWTMGDHSRFRSGSWIEPDGMGQEIMFDALALDIQGRKMIFISNDACSPQDKQSIIQKGRNLALHFHDLMRSDRELQTLHDELEVMVRQRTEDLQEANQKLASELEARKQMEAEREEMARQLRQSQKMEAIGTLAGGIAHDFNNILSAIIGFTELSIMTIEENERLIDMQEKILGAANRAKDLVRQILTFSRQTEQEKRPVRLKDIIVEVLQLMRASIPSSIDIDTRIHTSAYILADPTQMHQVLMNLSTNAWYAMKEGGTLTVSVEEQELAAPDLASMPELSPGTHVTIRVTDTGCGMAPELMERIFDPYYTTREKDKGTGLGLSVVHGIVAKTGGCIRVQSTPGKGSTFTIRFPALGSSVQSVAPKIPARTGSGEQILVVDDEPFQTDIAKDYLTRLGYRVTVARDSLDALDLVMEDPERFSLVIADIIMPKLSGKALGEKLLTLRPDLPVILSTGYSDDADADTLVAAGFHSLLMKPVGIRDLARAVQSALHAS